ncbi:alpha/beta hydrolase [Halomonas eurihalina]|uniref:Alpha/beta hydrolase n=1 Tax=Halomonas eurihalina TaxID=42566 RepID=A0A5D9D4U9_HALER|nr:alpha/beta hydrolase fold domain-containing protein [Halomonas eurihalina]MDR5858806.1 alpha/beta hydrolase fold domain-containing protein [Halomonas eurihalina]TZG38944.1 alpha/beta hydrolase [Halomonas eurihalina]
MQIDAFRRCFERGLDALAGLPIEAAWRRYDALCIGFAPADPAGMTITDERIAGIDVRRFQPAAVGRGPVLYAHGGGWNLGSVRSHHGIAADLAERLGLDVISVDYHLLPEASYAEALDDCRRVAEACAPVALVGDSAGGRLVMDVARLSPWRGVLGLIYPPVGRPTPETLGADAPLLSRDDILTLWRTIAGDVPMPDDASPPTVSLEVLAVEHDPLTRPLEMAIAAWRLTGASIGYRCAPGMLHGALHAHAELPAMHDAWRDFCQALANRLA